MAGPFESRGLGLEVTMMEWMIANRERRRNLGIFYTPSELIEPILDAALDPILAAMHDEASCAARLAGLSVIDPACGSGHFLIAAWRRLARRVEILARPQHRLEMLRRAAASLHGIDVDPQAARLGASSLRDECERWGLEPRDFVNWFTLADALLDEGVREKSFDLVIGNPPFVDSESMCAANRSRRIQLASKYETARGNWDLASLFVERAIQLVKPGGRIGLVLPRRLLASDHAQHVQRLMASETIESIRLNDADAFEDAAVETVSIVMQRGAPREDHCIRLSGGAASEWRIEQRVLHLLPPGHWSAILRADVPRVGEVESVAIRREIGCTPTLPATAEPGEGSSSPKPQVSSPWCPTLDVLNVLHNHPRIADRAFVGDGATTAEAYRIREAIMEADECAAPCVQLINTGTIDPFRSLWGRRPTRYLRGAWSRPVVPLAWLEQHLPRRAAQARSSKVLVAGLAGRIEAVVDQGEAMCGKSAVQIIPHEPAVCHALCAWLNSSPINAIYRLLFESRGFGSRSMHLGPRQIEQLPMWRADGPGYSEAVEELAALSRRLHDGAAPRASVDHGETTRLLACLDSLVEHLLARE